MDKIELVGLIARVRRGTPRNVDVMTVCNELDERTPARRVIRRRRHRGAAIAVAVDR
jgi:hypothetical protein